jgi:hypothetical protein
VSISRGPLNGLWVEETIPTLRLLEPTENCGILTVIKTVDIQGKYVFFALFKKDSP